MKEISTYQTLYEYWEELRVTFRDAPYKTRPRKSYQKQLKVESRSGELAVALLSRYAVPTCLRITKLHGYGNNLVTKLDVAEHFTNLDNFTRSYIGHLMVTPEPHQKAHGLHIVRLSDIPPESQAIIDQGVELLADNFCYS